MEINTRSEYENYYLKKPMEKIINLGKHLFLLSIIGLGITLILSKAFLVGLLPITDSLSKNLILVYITGLLLIIPSVFILMDKYAYYCSLTIGFVFVIFIFGIHVPKLAEDITNASLWTVTFETIALCSGFILLLNANRSNMLLYLLANYLLFVSLFVFGVLHLLYNDFILTLLPEWIPFPVLWSYLVIIGFMSSATSILFQKWIKYSMLLLSIMFYSWVLILHLPRVINNFTIEAEWTSLFVALAMGSIALIELNQYKNGKAENQLE